MKPTKLTGNWTPDGKAERAALRRDYLELTPGQRMKQVFESCRGSCPGSPRPATANVAPELGELAVRVVSYEDVVVLKQQAGRPEDLADLRRLSQARGEEP